MLSYDHKVMDKGEKQRIRDMGVVIHDTQGRVGGMSVFAAICMHVCLCVLVCVRAYVRVWVRACERA